MQPSLKFWQQKLNTFNMAHLPPYLLHFTSNLALPPLSRLSNRGVFFSEIFLRWMWLKATDLASSEKIENLHTHTHTNSYTIICGGTQLPEPVTLCHYACGMYGKTQLQLKQRAFLVFFPYQLGSQSHSQTRNEHIKNAAFFPSFAWFLLPFFIILLQKQQQQQ